EVFPDLFGARTVEFRAGSELRLLNGCISLLYRTRRNWVSWSGVLQRAAKICSWMGHDYGAIGVEVAGDIRRRACIVADSRAERIAVMPASVTTVALLSGVRQPDCSSYNAWLSEDELRAECERRGFRLVVEEF